MYVASMRKSFKDSLKVLEADIQHANSLASDFPREHDGACVQMRMSYSPAAHLFLFLVQWTDVNLAGALGLLRILIYKVYVDGTTTMSTHERKASIREFYGVIYPSLRQLPRGVTDTEDKRQKAVCVERYKKREDDEFQLCSDVDIEREEECGICMEMNSKIVLPNCNHAMCFKCYREWRARSQSCPFCRDSLKRVDSCELWVFVDSKEAIDMVTITRENLKRLFMYIDKLPLVIPDSLFDNYDSHLRASDFPREHDGACVQMRMSYSPAAHLFLFLVQWTDVNLAGALGLLRILIYKVYVDGTTTMSTHERKASIREFYGVIYPSLRQLPRGVTDTEDKRQKAVCVERYKKREDDEFQLCSDVDIEREEECGICMEMNSKIVLPNCNHAMCFKCYREWRARSQSCPFCRDSLKRVDSCELWVFVDSKEAIDMVTITRENLKRLFMYIDKLPLVIPDSLFDNYDSHLR